MKLKTAVAPRDLRSFGAFAREIKLNYVLYLMALPGLIYYITFCYIPMYNIIISFIIIRGRR
jgi:putative aldouronate transport system permease protein